MSQKCVHVFFAKQSFVNVICATKKSVITIVDKNVHTQCYFGRHTYLFGVTPASLVGTHATLGCTNGSLGDISASQRGRFASLGDTSASLGGISASLGVKSASLGGTK